MWGGASTAQRRHGAPTWRLVVPREDKSTRSGRKQPDVIDVVCWSAVTRRAAGRLQIGQDVEVGAHSVVASSGQLRVWAAATRSRREA